MASHFTLVVKVFLKIHAIVYQISYSVSLWIYSCVTKAFFFWIVLLSASFTFSSADIRRFSSSLTISSWCSSGLSRRYPFFLLVHHLSFLFSLVLCLLYTPSFSVLLRVSSCIFPNRPSLGWCWLLTFFFTTLVYCLRPVPCFPQNISVFFSSLRIFLLSFSGVTPPSFLLFSQTPS